MKPELEEGTAWSQYELSPTECLRLKRAVYNIWSILGNRFTRRGGTFWVSVSEDLLEMAQYGVSYVGNAEPPTHTRVRVLDYLFGILIGLGGAMILGWHP